MKRILQSIIVLLLFCISAQVWAQSQTVNNGDNTAAVNFSGAGCSYKWVNNTPGIGLPASGTGNIPSFTAVNSGSSAVTATITATPAPTGFAYIANQGDNTVSVIDISTNSIIKTINVGQDPNGVTVSPDGSRAYVANYISNDISVINTNNNKVIATITAGLHPQGMCTNSDGSLLYVANDGSNTVSVINTSSYALVGTIPTGVRPIGVTLNSAGTLLYVVNFISNTVSVINTSDNSLASTINVGTGPNLAVVTPDGKFVYVNNDNAASVSVIDVSANAVVKTINVGQFPDGLTMSPDGSRVYVASGGTNKISVINTATNDVINTYYAVNSAPFGISLSRDGTMLYVQNFSSNDISVIDVTSTADRVVTNIQVGSQPGSFGGNFITGGASCSPVTFTIKVNAAPPGITAPPATGTIASCVGVASSSPNIQQIKVSGNGLTGNITATAPPGFEVSLTAGSGYDMSVFLVPSGGGVSNKIVYVRSAASATGSISGNVRLQSPGITEKDVAVKGVVKALPTVNSVSNQTVPNGGTVTAVNFTGAGNTFNWTNDKPGIGLAASGTGNIASFTAVNGGASPVIATVKVTPLNSALAYICNSGSGNVSVINTGTNKVIATIPVGTSPLGAASSPDGTRMYIANGYTNDVSVINTATNTVIATVGVGRAPQGLVVSPDGNHIYVASNLDGTVTVINAVTNGIDAVIPVGISPASICISADGSRVYVANTTSNSISIIDASGNDVINTINTGESPIGIAISPDGDKVYVTNPVLSSISIYNTTTTGLIKTIGVGTDPVGVAISPDGTRAYVANTIDNTVTVINAVNNTIITNVNVGVYPYAVSVTDDGTKVYVTDQNSNQVSVIDAASNAVIATIPVGTAPASLGNFIARGSGCIGAQTSFNITVNPSVPTITVGPVAGIISACKGSVSVSPNIQQFTVSGSGLTTGITATAPTGFEISLTKGSGYTGSLVLNQSAGAVNNKVIYVRSAASATSSISGQVTLTSAGATVQGALVNGRVNELSAVDKPGDQTLTTGSNTTAVNFTGTGNYFTWTNDKPSIGLAASGDGNIASFTTSNTGSTPVVATVTVTPKSIDYGYIANQNDNTVSVINTLTNTVITTIPVGRSPYNVEASPDGKMMYVVNRADKTISVISTTSNSVTTNIHLTDIPNGVVMSPDGSKLYVSISGNTILVVNTSTNSVSSTFGSVPSPYGLILNADGSKLYATDYSNGNVSIINTATGAIMASVIIGPGTLPTGLALSADGGTLYVANQGANTITVVSTVTNAVVTTIQQTGKLNVPVSIAVSPDGTKAYVANAAGRTVTVINTATNTINGTITVGETPLGVSFNSDGFLYVANASSNTVSVIDPASDAVVGTINVGTTPTSLGGFISKGSNCPGVPVKFTITVNNAIPAVIVPGSVAGSISACAGSPSSSPNIQQFTVSGSGLTADVTAAAPAGFEISFTAGGGYGNNLILTQTGGGINNKVIYVRSAAGASGDISGNVTLTSAGAITQNVAVAGNVRGIPVANLPGNIIVTTGSPTGAINFTGNANTFTWINDTPSIGLPATGTGNIASFIAVNTGSTPVTATVRVSPILAGIAYISNQGSNNISVINTLTNSVTATIPVGKNPYGVAVTPDGSQMYVINLADNTVSVINTTTNTVIKTIPVGNGPNGITASPDGSKIYVSNLNDNTISVISTSSNSVIKTIPAGSGPYGLVLSPDGSRIYVTNYSSNKLTVIDATNYSIIATINVGAMPEGVAVTPDGKQVYVVNNTDNSVVVIDAATNTFSKLITVGLYPVAIAISPDGSQAYVANAGANTVSVISTATNKVTGTINVGNTPTGVSFNSDGYLYVSNSGSNTVSVIDITNNSLVGNIGVGTSPTSLGNFISKGTNCTGAPVTFTIEVDPSSAKIVAGPVSGKIIACAGAVSVSPNVQQFTVSGSGLLSDIIAAAPTGFQVSLNKNSGYSSSITLVRAAGSVNGTIVYVRAAANSAGGIGGNVILTSASAVSQNVAVYGVISPIPTVNSVGDQNILAGSPTNAVNFTGVGNTFTWVNDTPGIGLAASGTGDIASFAAINAGSSPVKATITVYPAIAPYAYIANNASNDVSVINTLTDKVIMTIPVENGPAGVAVSPDGSRAYVANSGSGTVSIINTTTNKVIGSAPVGQFPFGIVVSPDGSKVYVANYSSNFISVINTSNYAVEAQFYVDATPDALAISPDGSTLYISSFSTNTVDVVSTVSYGKIKSIISGSSPIGIALSPDGSRIYVANSAETYVSVIDVNTGAPITTILTGIYPNGISVSPDGSKVYVTSSGSGTVSVIDAASNTLKATLHVGSKPNGLSVSPDGSKVYVTNPNSQNVSVINAADNTILTTIPVSTNPNSFGNFITNGSTCTGAPVKFTITVNASTANITAGPVTGAIFACIGSPSVNPNLQQFNVSGSSLSADITATAPTGFEVSLTPASGFANSVTITQAGGSVAGTIVYVRSAASATGSIFGNVLLTSAGATVQKALVTGIVNALPTVNAVTNQSYTNGQTTNAIPFSGTGSTFTWTNDTPGIGLAASGTGDLPVFTATNIGTSPVKATITVTPVPSGFAYITNFGSNDVSVINTTTNKLVATIQVGTNPIGVAISPNGSRVYVSNQGSKSVSVINTADNTVAATIPVGSKPTGLVVSRDGTKLFVANSGDGFISVINTADNSLITNLSVGLQPTGLAVSPDGKFVYVTNYEIGNVFVIDASNYAPVYTINIGSHPLGIAVSPDGSQLYVGYGGQYLAVVTTTTNTVLARIQLNVETQVDPRGISVSPDGKFVYVADATGYSVAIIVTGATPGLFGFARLPGSFPYGVSVNADGSKIYVVNADGNLSVINQVDETSGSDVSAYIGVGSNPQTFGNFISNGTGCSGTPITFTITINATPVPLITTTGTPSPVSTTYGTPSPSTSFTVSGANLTTGILVTPPTGLEVSTDNVNFSSTVLVGTGGNVTPQAVYLRLKSTTFVGTYPGKTKLTSAGATEVDVTTTNNIVNPAPLTITANNINKPLGATITGSSGAVEFTSQGLQNSETIGSITVAYGAGSESSAIAGTYIGSVVASAATGGTFTGSNYTITYRSGNIIIPDAAIASITYAGTLSPLGTIYGTPSSSTSFTVSGANLGSGILVTAPNGFEVSTDGFTFSNTVTIGVAGNVSNTLVYLRLKATSPVDNYSDPVVLTSNGAPTKNVPTMLSTVSPALITIAAGTVTKTYGAALMGAAGSTNYTISSGSLQNGEVINTVTIAYGAGADISAAPGTYPGSVMPSDPVGSNGFSASNYTITPTPADILVKKAVLIVTADNKSKIFGTANPELTVTYNGFVNNEGVAQLSSLPVITTDAVTLSPVGKYVITVSGATAVNYSFNYVFGILTVNPDIKLIVINNTFTPNGDGINDTWTIENLNSYTNNTVGVYNRYGEKVYSSVGYGIPWDGTYNGKPLPTGTYYYIINLKNGSKALSGWVAIIR